MLAWAGPVIGGVRRWGRESTGEVEEYMTEDDVGRGDIETGDWVEKRVLLQGIVSWGLDVLEVVGEVGKVMQFHVREQQLLLVAIEAADTRNEVSCGG